MLNKIISYSVVHPLGFSPDDLFGAIVSGKTGLVPIVRSHRINNSFAAIFSTCQNTTIANLCPYDDFTRFEKLLWIVAHDALAKANIDTSSQELLFVIATAKGSIEEIGKRANEELTIPYSVNKVLRTFKVYHSPVIISNACISGLSAIIAGNNLLHNDNLKYVIVVGADTVNDFVLSGFDSLLALSDEECRPFDKDRKGINLGEGGGAIVFEKTKQVEAGSLYYTGGCITNDANHISGPSRTGEELAFAIQVALNQSDITIPDFISAHGTGTEYNDEMEGNALALCSIQKAPVHSLKPYLGHVLGAAGILETIVCLEMLHSGTLIPLLNYHTQGTTVVLNVQESIEKRALSNCVKTMSAFGGGNAAICLKKATPYL